MIEVSPDKIPVRGSSNSNQSTQSTRKRKRHRANSGMNRSHGLSTENSAHVDESKSEMATQTVSSNSTNTKKEIYVLGDSILKNLDSNKLSGEAKVQVRSFPGCTALDTKDHAKPILRKNPAEVIIHVGTNNLCENKSTRKCADEVIDLA